MNVRIERLWHKNAYGIWIARQEGDVFSIAKPVRLDFVAQPEVVMWPEPTLEMRPEFAQSFFQAMLDEMARHGLRANNDKVAGQLEAQSKHLDDMRKLVFDK